MHYEKYWLEPRHDGRKSFWKKAYVEVMGTTKTLYSYNTRVVSIREQGVEFTQDAWYSQTTRRHVREFCMQENIPDPYDKKRQVWFT